MAHNYLSYITDEHLFNCIKTLHNSYIKSKENISKKKFYKNKIDTIKLIFDAKFNEMDQESIIKTEINRQIDKSINNSIGTFHEQILGGIHGFEMGNLSGYDIKATDNSLFADIKNKHNTMNSSSAESLFQKLASFADTHKTSTCFWVQILAKKSFVEKWEGDINGKEYSHSRVYKISGDQFYSRLTGKTNAFFELYEVLPIAINDYLSTLKTTQKSHNTALNEIILSSKKSNNSILDQITSENYNYYSGFDSLE